MCLGTLELHPDITSQIKRLLKKLNEESGPNCFIDSTVKSSTALGFICFFLPLESCGLSSSALTQKKTKKPPDRRRWFSDSDQMIRSESAEGASVQRLTPTSHFCFLRQQEKEPHSDIPAEVKEKQRSAVSPCTVLLQRKTHFRKKKKKKKKEG